MVLFSYETVAEIGEEPPMTPTTPTIITSFSSLDIKKDEPLTPTTPQPVDAHTNRSRGDLMSIPELSAVGSSTSLSGGQQSTTRQQQQQTAVARTNSDNSLHSAEMDGDRESIKRYRFLPYSFLRLSRVLMQCCEPPYPNQPPADELL